MRRKQNHTQKLLKAFKAHKIWNLSSSLAIISNPSPLSTSKFPRSNFSCLIPKRPTCYRILRACARYCEAREKDGEIESWMGKLANGICAFFYRVTEDTTKIQNGSVLCNWRSHQTLDVSWDETCWTQIHSQSELHFDFNNFIPDAFSFTSESCWWKKIITRRWRST